MHSPKDAKFHFSVIGRAALVAVCLLATPGAPARAGNDGDLKLETSDAIPQSVVYQGDQKELTLTLSSTATRPVGPVVIAIVSRGGVVEIVRDKSIRWRGKGGEWTGQLARLKPGVVLPFKIKLNYAPQILASTKALVDGKLTVTASLEGETSAMPAQIEQAWKMGNCAGAYRQALSAIGTRYNDPLKETIKSVRSGWRALPGNWLFPPARVKYGKTLRAVMRRATPLIRYRGVDPKLRQAVQGREIARAVLDLDNYVNQPGSPTLCTGASDYMGFFEQRLETFHGQHDGASQSFERAAQVADWQLLEGEAAVAASVEVPEGGDRETLEVQKQGLADVLRDARAAWSHIVDADAAAGVLPDHISRLTAIRSRFGEIKLDRRSPLRGRKLAVQTALTAVEAMTYLRGSYAKHDEIASRFSGLIGAVRSAHGENCVCSRQ